MNSNHSQKYCKDHGLRYQAMIEVSKLIRQLSTLLHINDKFPKKLSVPTAEQQKLILKVLSLTLLLLFYYIDCWWSLC